MDSGRVPSAPPPRSAHGRGTTPYQSGYNRHQPLHTSTSTTATATATTSAAAAYAGGLVPPQLHLTPEKLSQIHIRDHPHRAIAIESTSGVLILRYSASTSDAISSGQLASVPGLRPSRDNGPVAKVMAEFKPVTRYLLDNYRKLTHQPIYGTLGLIAVEGDVFLCVVTRAMRAATVRPRENVEKIASVAFFCLSSADWDDIVALDAPDVDILEYNPQYGPSLGRREVAGEHPCQALQKLLSNGSFYYSTDFDVTNRCQDRPVEGTSFDMDAIDDGNLWNRFMIEPLVKFRSRLQPHEQSALDASKIMTLAFRGFCRSMAIPQASAPLRHIRSGLPSSLTVISRLSSKRAGTRFLSRGIDDDGNVANFVETETTYWTPAGTLFSYAQVRGSVPVFWEQATDLIPGRQRITITRSADGAQPAFDQHFQFLTRRYGAVHAVNLLSEEKPGEVELSDRYMEGFMSCPSSQNRVRDHALLRQTHYDFHAETRGAAGYEAANGIRRYISASTENFAYYLAEDTDDSNDDGGGGDDDGGARTGGRMRTVVVLQQEGVFRTNCLDCLDRTNLIQTIVSRMAVETFLQHKGSSAGAGADFWVRHSTLWADNGDALSKIYAGTGALKTSFTRHGKSSLAGTLADMRKSVQRLYHNNFVDPGKQITIDMLLGRLLGQAPVSLFDPISDFVSMELHKRRSEYQSFKDINIFVGTYNVNGKAEGIDDDLSAWLCPQLLADQPQPEIVVVGFQEIVELSPQHIVNTDPSRKHAWEQAVRSTLNKHAKATGGEGYVLLRSGQLVGAALCVFVTRSALPGIKNVEGSVKKTGMSGMAGNKGAVAIRMDYVNTAICFVTAHLAAGFANYDERNRDYVVISQGLLFQRNRGIADHDTVFWLGDFNYRIGLGLEKTKMLLQKEDLDSLYDNDQLNLQMMAGLAFQHYSEARITFLPTYKYDIGTDDYDTSEKARIPAWTDRILRKGANARQLSYNSAPLRYSDHRPVYATFRCTVSVVNEEKRQAISDELYKSRKAEVGDSTANEGGDSDTDDEDLIGYDSIEPGLPPSSSDRQKWWLDNRKAARSVIVQPTDLRGIPMALNPQRRSNPFALTDEPDWVSVSPSPSRVSTSSLSSSPYEHVSMSNMFSTSNASVTPRRPLPPPPEPFSTPPKPRAFPGDDNELRGRPLRRDTAPPPPPPRRSTARTASPEGSSGLPTSNSSSNTQPPPGPRRPSSTVALHSAQPASSLQTTKAAAPPVARKPAHLSSGLSSPNGNSVSNAMIAEGGGGGGGGKSLTLPLRPPPELNELLSRPMSQASGRNMATVPSGIRAPAAPVKSTGMAGAVSLPGMTGAGSTKTTTPMPTPMPARKSVPSQGVDDLLGSLDDEGGVELSSWNTLQPNA